MCQAQIIGGVATIGERSRRRAGIERWGWRGQGEGESTRFKRDSGLDQRVSLKSDQNIRAIIKGDREVNIDRPQTSGNGECDRDTEQQGYQDVQQQGSQLQRVASIDSND